MKKILVSITTLSLLTLSVAAQEQLAATTDASKTGTRQQQAANAPKTQLVYNERAFQQLDLTPEQKGKLQNINAEYQKELSAISSASDKKTVSLEKEKLEKKRSANACSVLTEVQLKKLRTIKIDETENTVTTKQTDSHIHHIEMQKNLELSDEQLERITIAEAAYNSKVAVIKNDAKLNASEKVVGLKELKSELQDSYKNILTPDQVTKFKELERVFEEKHASDK